MKRWTVGKGKAPDWLRDRIAPYLALDGGTAWEISIHGRSYTVRRGDIVTMTDSGYISVETTGRDRTIEPGKHGMDDGGDPAAAGTD